MIMIFAITALLIVPAAILILVGDQVDPLSEAKRISRKTARASDDRTQLRIRLEELGKASDKDYEEFRIRQYGYCAGAAAIALAFLVALPRDCPVSAISNTKHRAHRSFTSSNRKG